MAFGNNLAVREYYSSSKSQDRMNSFSVTTYWNNNTKYICDAIKQNESELEKRKNICFVIVLYAPF